MFKAVLSERIFLGGMSIVAGMMLLSGCRSNPPVVPVPQPPASEPPVVIESVAPQVHQSAPTVPESEPAAEKKIAVAPENVSSDFDKKLNGKAFDVPTQQMFCNAIVGANGKGGFLTSNSFILSWYLIGPFKFRQLDNSLSSQAIHKEFISCERVPPRDTHRWIFSGGLAGKTLGEVDLSRVFGTPEPNSAAYALTLLYVPEDMSNLLLLTGSDDYIKVWINGRLVHTYNMTDRDGQLDQDKVSSVKLSKGYNLLVVKVVNINDRWNFFFRFATADGSPIEFRQQTVSGQELDQFCRRLEKEIAY